MTDGYAVKVSGLTIRFGDFTAVDNISFSVARGEIFGFLGANGAGKTTTIRVLCGLLMPTSGQVSIADLVFEKGLSAIKSRVGYMSQKFTLYEDLTVEENLAFAASLRKLNRENFRKRTKELFEFIDFEYDSKTLVRDLPGGIKQQVSLVAAILHDPEIVFLDEPTAGVSPASRARFWALIRELSGSGKTVFVTTHYMDEAEQCGRIALMRTGRIIACDTPNGLKDAAFPEPLVEIESKSNAPLDWLEELKKDTSVGKLRPYGMRYHLAVRDTNRWEKFYSTHRMMFDAKVIRPSLEDVFIRLTEEVPL